MTASKTIQIGDHTATMQIDSEGAFSCSWSPAYPRKLSQSELEVYNAAVIALRIEARNERERAQ